MLTCVQTTKYSVYKAAQTFIASSEKKKKMFK